MIEGPANHGSPRRCAVELVERVLRDVLPPGAPPSFARVIGARFVGPQQVRAELEMIDGLPAEIEVWEWLPGAWAHRWLRFEGGDLCWKGGRWQRVCRG